MNKKIFTLIFIFALLFLLGGTISHRSMVAVNTASSIATIYLDPQTSFGEIDQNFIIKINVSDVVDLYGWEIRLKWNSTILDALAVNEGPFLKSGGNTFFTYKVNNTLGNVIVDCTLLGNVPGVSGSGTLATLQFYVETVGECPLDLYDTILVNSAEQLIEHSAVDGYYYTSVHDVAVVDLATSSSTVNVTVENQGTHTETFNVSAYYTRLTDPLIGTQTITLERGTKSTLNFAWTPPAYGRYEIRAEASIVPGEVDTADNSRTTIVYVGYGGSNIGERKGESFNGYHVAICLFALFLPVTMLSFRKTEEISILDVPAALLKETIGNKLTCLDPWQIWIKEKVQFKLA